MHILNQMDPNLYLEVLRKQAQVWDELRLALADTWGQWTAPKRTLDVVISLDEILADLAYGRD